MNRKSMIAMSTALVLLLGGAAGAYYYVDNKKTNEETAAKSETESLDLMSFDSTSVKGIDITGADGYFHMTLGQTGDWILEETDYPYNFTLNSYYLNVVASTMSKLKADHKADKADLGKYGLDKPITVVCHTADKDHTLLVGNISATNEFCYVMLPDDDNVYCVVNNTEGDLRGDISELRSPYLLNCYDNDINSFSLVHNGEVLYDLSRGTDGETLWSLNAPKTDVMIDAVTVNNILTNMVRIQSDKFEGFTKDSSELAKHGLDNPAYTFTVTTDDKTFKLEFPEFGAEDEEIWCYDTDSCAVCALSQNSAAFLSGKWYDLTTKQAMSIPFMSAASLEINVDGEKHTLTIDHDKNSYVFDDIDVTALGSEEASSDFEYLYASVSEIAHDEYRDDEPETMGEPTCTFRYTLIDGTERVLALVPIDGETYWAYTDGRCLGMTVSRNALTGTNGCLNFIERLTNDIKGG